MVLSQPRSRCLSTSLTASSSSQSSRKFLLLPPSTPLFPPTLPFPMENLLSSGAVKRPHYYLPPPIGTDLRPNLSGTVRRWVGGKNCYQLPRPAGNTGRLLYKRCVGNTDLLLRRKSLLFYINIKNENTCANIFIALGPWVDDAKLIFYTGEFMYQIKHT